MRAQRPAIQSPTVPAREVLLKLHIIYRSTGPANRKRRPQFFDKLLSLASLLRSAALSPEEPELIFVNDGSIPEPRLSLMRSAGRVFPLDGLGNSGSYRAAMNMAQSGTWPDDDLVYFVEDDYLHIPQALTKLVAAAAELDRVSYFTLYDHPDRYRGGRDADRGRTELFFSGGHHWRTVESSCMTFAGRLWAVRADRWIHWLGTVPRTPRDRLIWHATQRLGPFRTLPRPRHLLVSAVPSLATHLEDDMLSPGVAWPDIADDVRAWAIERAIPVGEES